ncbi:chaplin family protein [Actinomadura rugatobispora]|uniref:Chaplin family protein n=1 Tax=Actinomadura rugatobispora TaxID=1994 RepID=A0ABW1AJ87_9ACTN|nr:hypothetical protein GCM10010200_029990 [Actinomadura rugatobispora]
MRNWTRNIARTALVAAGIAMAGTGPGTASADITSGERGSNSGNQIFAPQNTPINICGNAIGVVSVAKAWCVGGAHVHGGKGNVTSGKHSIGGGNQIDRSQNTPINVCGNSVGVVGVAKGDCPGGATVNGGHDHGKGSSQHRASASVGDASGSKSEGPLSGVPTGQLTGTDPVRPVSDLAGSVGLPADAPATSKPGAPRPALPKAPAPKPRAAKPQAVKAPAAQSALPLEGLKLPSTARQNVPTGQRTRDIPEAGGMLREAADTLGLPSAEGLPDASGLPGAQGLTDTIGRGLRSAQSPQELNGTLAGAPAALPAAGASAGETVARRVAEQDPPDPTQGVRKLIESLGVAIRPLQQKTVPTPEQANQLKELKDRMGQQKQQQPGRPPAQAPAQSAPGGRPTQPQQQRASEPPLPLPLDGLPISVGRGTPLNP